LSRKKIRITKARKNESTKKEGVAVLLVFVFSYFRAFVIVFFCVDAAGLRLIRQATELDGCSFEERVRSPGGAGYQNCHQGLRDKRAWYSSQPSTVKEIPRLPHSDGTMYFGAGKSAASAGVTRFKPNLPGCTWSNTTMSPGRSASYHSRESPGFISELGTPAAGNGSGVPRSSSGRSLPHEEQRPSARFCGTVVEQKGQGLAIEAMSHVSNLTLSFGVASVSI
jgi:hypothetical protein